MKSTYSKVLAWTKRNERHVATAVFVFGFLSDIATYVLIPVSVANLLFIAYLVLSAVCTLGSHALESHARLLARISWLRKLLDVVLPLGAQYFLGGLLSGFLIFYTKSAAVLVSWPFLLFLLVIFLGNEIFRGYRAHLAFQTVLFFFSLYAYLIFELPLLVHSLGTAVFLESTAAATVLFVILLLILAGIGWNRFKNSLLYIFSGASLIVVCIVGSYFTALIPPIPLTLTDGGIYHGLTHEAGGYQVQAEAMRPWWQVWEPVVIHHVPGTTLYAYSAVFAPVKFSTSVVHEWQHYDTQKKRWETVATLAFPIVGGRAGGYRGYSYVNNLPAGKWRVYVETPSGQVIGRIDFVVEDTITEPTVVEEVK